MSTWKRRRSKKKNANYVLNYTVGNVAKRSGESRAEVRKWLKKRVKQLGTCPFCQTALSVGTFAVDHKDPISRGGSALLSNCWLTCQSCNRAKGDLTVEEFQGLLAFLTSQSEAMKKSVLMRLRAAGVMFKR